MNPIFRSEMLLLSLGEFHEQEQTPAVRTLQSSIVQDIYQNESDPGLHAAAEWLLRTWNQLDWLRKTDETFENDARWKEKRLEQFRNSLERDNEDVQPTWYINGQGQTMVVIPGPVEFEMGSPTTEEGRKPDETQHHWRIGRSFAISSHLVTKEQYLRFDGDFDNQEMSKFPEASCPIGGVIWHEAAEYCNWLSLKEGIAEDQLCYEIENHQVVRLKENYLNLGSYRLPTEAELEYAARAGTTTSRCFGEAEELLPKYAWYTLNSKERTWPVGSLKPNDLGIFDAHGHLWAWCQNSFIVIPNDNHTEVFEDREDDILLRKTRGLRGGSFVVLPSSLRSATRNSIEPTSRFSRYGIRLARTLSNAEPQRDSRTGKRSKIKTIRSSEHCNHVGNPSAEFAKYVRANSWRILSI